MEDLFPETLYRIPEPPVLILPEPWETIPEEGRKTISNLCAAIRSRPAPRVVVMTDSDLRHGDLPGLRLIAFGNGLNELGEDQVESFRGVKIIRTATPVELSGNPGRKKILWSAIQALLAGS